MGKISHSAPKRFAEELRSYLWEQIAPQQADRSGRWLEAATSKARSRDYWRKVINGDQAMTSNDIEIVAAIFEQTPYEFIRAVRDWAAPSATVHYPAFGGAAIDDEKAIASPITEEDPDSGYDGA